MDPTLYKAAMKGDIDGLIRYKDRFETQLTPKVNTVLHIAAMYGKTRGVDMILGTCPSLLGRVNSQDETPLHMAAREGHTGIVQSLFEDRQNFDTEIGRFSQEMLGGKNVDDDTAFHMAVRNGHLDVVKLLLEKDSTISYLPNIKEETPLYFAGEKGFDKIVSEILKICTSLLYGGPNGRTVLHAAVIFGSQECTKKLLKWRGSLAKEADVDGWTPLHHAASLGHKHLVKNLLDLDKSVAYVTSNENDGKNTALHIAASQGHVNVIEVLLSICPDCWEIDNIKGQNILHIAMENKKDNVIEYIKKKSSLINGLINQKDNAGNISDPQLLAAPTDVPNNEMINAPKELSRTNASSDSGFQKLLSNLSDSQNDSIEALRKMAETHMIVAALIATVTFTAGLAVPGGYYGNDGPIPGMAILSRNGSFIGFIITDTISLMLSVVAIALYFDAAMCNDKAKLKRKYMIAALFTFVETRRIHFILPYLMLTMSTYLYKYKETPLGKHGTT